MTFGLLAGFALILACVWLIAEPLIGGWVNRIRLGRENCNGITVGQDDAQTMANELELDFKMGKMSNSDYELLKNQKINNQSQS